MSKNKIRYCLDQDNDGHWYVVPVDRMKEWRLCLFTQEDDEEVPDFAEFIGGSPTLVSFENYEIG